MGESTQKKPIVINLKKSSEVKSFDQGEIVQRAAMQRLASLMREQLTNNETTSKDDNLTADGSPLFLKRNHNTILIHGGRGSGKTTFVRNAFDMIMSKDKDKDKFFHSQDDDKTFKSVKVLSLIDPTLIENKENMFVTVVNKIKQAVEHHKKCSCYNKDEEEKYTSWKKSLKEMAGGITLLDGIGSKDMMGDSWEDAQYVMSEGLDKMQSGNKLEKLFHDFVEKSLNYIGGSAFVLAFDDTDTSFERGWPVLEVLRRYLTSPKLITLLVGDLDLYTMLVRGEKWKNFNSNQLKHDEGRKKSIEKMVDHLESQYLMKVVQPNNRISILPLNRIDEIMVSLSGIKAEQNTKEKTYEDEEKLNEFIGNKFEKEKGFSGNMPELVRRQPLRTVIQFLKTAEENPDFPMEQQVASIFNHSLLKYNLTADELQESSGVRLMIRLAEFLTHNGLWKTGHNLQANHQDDDLNWSLIVWSVYIIKEMKKHKFLGMDYMLRIALTSEILNSILQDQELKKDEFESYTFINNNRSLTHITGRLICVTADKTLQSPNPKLKGMKFGAIRTLKEASKSTKDNLIAMYGTDDKNTIANTEQKYLQKFKEIRKGKTNNQAMGYYYNTLDSLIDRLYDQDGIQDKIIRQVASIPACHMVNPQGERQTYLSIYIVQKTTGLAPWM